MKYTLAQAVLAALLSTGAQAALPLSNPTPPMPTVATNPTTPHLIEARRGRGADDPAGHTRRGRGADDPMGHA
jgi:hypothetical protein